MRLGAKAGWLKDRVEGRYRGQRKVCYFLYARDRLKVGGVMRHDVAGRASIGRDQCGPCSNVPFMTDVRTLSMKCASFVKSFGRWQAYESPEERTRVQGMSYGDLRV